MTALVICAMLTSIAFAARIAWKPNVKPPISLRLALALAEAELETQEVEFFCLRAGFIGHWEFHFGSETGKELWVAVGRDRTVRKSTEPFEY